MFSTNMEAERREGNGVCMHMQQIRGITLSPQGLQMLYMHIALPQTYDVILVSYTVMEDINEVLILRWNNVFEHDLVMWRNVT